MSRALLNLVIDLAAATLFLGMVATGYVLEFALPPGTSQAIQLWGIARDRWGDIHFWISLNLLAVVALHLCLHWRWVVATVNRRLGLADSPSDHSLRTGLAILLGAAVVFGLLAWVTQSAVKDTTDGGHPGVSSHVGLESTAPTAGRPPASRITVAFWEDVYPIFEASCLSCHGPRRQLGGFRADRREDYFGTPGRAALVVPGESARSLLITIVSGQYGILDPEVHRLPERDVARLRAWIDAGAAWPERPVGK